MDGLRNRESGESACVRSDDTGRRGGVFIQNGGRCEKMLRDEEGACICIALLGRKARRRVCVCELCDVRDDAGDPTRRDPDPDPDARAPSIVA